MECELFDLGSDGGENGLPARARPCFVGLGSSAGVFPLLQRFDRSLTGDVARKLFDFSRPTAAKLIDLRIFV